MDRFKESKKSLCSNCFNIKEKCSGIVHMVCGTDKKAGLAFVETCGSFNKEIKNNYTSEVNYVTVSYKPDSRVEMMGGGHEDPECKKLKK